MDGEGLQTLGWLDKDDRIFMMNRMHLENPA
jgi:hypothetical protein